MQFILIRFCPNFENMIKKIKVNGMNFSNTDQILQTSSINFGILLF